MICIEELKSIDPKHGKVVGVAASREGYVIVACEYAILRVWEDGTGIQRVTPGSSADRQEATGTDGKSGCGNFQMRDGQGFCRNCGFHRCEH